MAPDAAATSVNGKRKRVRKRNKRTTTTQIANDSDSSSSSSSSESEEENKSAIKPKVKTKKKSEASSSSSSSSSDSSDSEKEQQTTVSSTSKPDEKRHRKRVRKPKQNTGAEDTSAAQKSKENHNASDAVERFAKIPNPHEDKRLSEATSSALTYAKQYAVDKQKWKFNKARQEHLIRHMLSRAPQESTSEPVEKTEGEVDGEDVSQIHQPSWWPDEWNECVAFYLNTVQGGAKDRLLKRLSEAKDQTVPALVEHPAQISQPVQVTNQSATPVVSSKSVNFADMATAVDAQPSIEEQAEKEADRQKIIFERERASALLKLMGH